MPGIWDPASPHVRASGREVLVDVRAVLALNLALPRVELDSFARARAGPFRTIYHVEIRRLTKTRQGFFGRRPSEHAVTEHRSQDVLPEVEILLKLSAYGPAYLGATVAQPQAASGAFAQVCQARRAT